MNDSENDERIRRLTEARPKFLEELAALCKKYDTYLTLEASSGCWECEASATLAVEYGWPLFETNYYTSGQFPKDVAQRHETTWAEAQEYLGCRRG